MAQTLLIPFPELITSTSRIFLTKNYQPKNKNWQMFVFLEKLYYLYELNLTML